MPKGVMYPLREFTEFFLRSLPADDRAGAGHGPVGAAGAGTAAVRVRTPLVAMSGPPLMHGTGCWLGMMTPHLFGGTAVLLGGRGLDPIELWDTVAREAVQHLIVVGDAFAKPLLRALDETPDRWDLSSLRLMISSGAMFSADVKRGLIRHMPALAIADVLGSTEGGMGTSITTKDTPPSETAKFALNATSKVFTDDGREVQPGSGEIGMVANGGLVPIAYYKDPEKSARTFRDVDGVRYSFPGDMATIASDGTLVLVGRGTNCINTGGEKVFPEEVEEALKEHPAVEDALVFGVPDERFGQRVVGVVSLSPGLHVSADEIVDDARSRLSSYKLPQGGAPRRAGAAHAQRQAELPGSPRAVRVMEALEDEVCAGTWIRDRTCRSPWRRRGPVRGLQRTQRPHRRSDRYERVRVPAQLTSGTTPGRRTARPR